MSIKKFLNFFDVKFLKFIIVGTINTIFGTFIMFFALNVLHLNYWISSASNVVLASILSYFLNKYFTFQSKSENLSSIIKFSLNIAFCYFVAYGIAKPAVRFIFSGFGEVIQNNLALFCGMCLFTLVNYFGQRLFVFKS